MTKDKKPTSKKSITIKPYTPNATKPQSVVGKIVRRIIKKPKKT